MIRMKRYWERNGTRRPFPPLYEAAKKYGNRIYYEKPVYEKKGQCPWCGKPVTNKRRRFCSDMCRKEYEDMTVWHRGRDPYSLRILYRDKFICQDCGEEHVFINEYNMKIPIDDGQLEVHHEKPVSEGGGDEPENLKTLCVRCHKKRHIEMIINKKQTRQGR